MSAHTHREFVPGCFRCELGRDEEMAMTTDRSPSLDERDELLDLGRQDIILLADRCERAEELVRVLGEALVEWRSRYHRREGATDLDASTNEALAAYRAFTEANPTPGEDD